MRVTDEFMQAVAGRRASGRRATCSTGESRETYRARDLLRMIAEATHFCGDPGMQFDTTINDWHTCPNTGRINASNPCSEYMHLDNSACNLASLNLMKFVDDERRLRRRRLPPRGRHRDHGAGHRRRQLELSDARRSTENAHAFRELGLGYANLGALLMSLGLAVRLGCRPQLRGGGDGAHVRRGVSAVGAHRRGDVGPFAGYATNREPQLRRDRQAPRRSRTRSTRRSCRSTSCRRAARSGTRRCDAGHASHGVRNSQVTVLAPTGTIAFMMDCDTTGVEPDIALVKYKKLVGGGMLKIVNKTVPRALRRLGYETREVQDIVEYIDEHETIEGAPHLRDEHLPVFDCAFKPRNGRAHRSTARATSA